MSPTCCLWRSSRDRNTPRRQLRQATQRTRAWQLQSSGICRHAQTRWTSSPKCRSSRRTTSRRCSRSPSSQQSQAPPFPPGSSPSSGICTFFPISNPQLRINHPRIRSVLPPLPSSLILDGSISVHRNTSSIPRSSRFGIGSIPAHGIPSVALQEGHSTPVSWSPPPSSTRSCI